MKYPEIDRLVNRYRDLSACRNDIERAFDRLRQTGAAGGLIMACGSGPGGFIADHFVNGLLRAFQRERPVPQTLRSRLQADHGQAGVRLADSLEGAMPAVALGTTGGWLTGNAGSQQAEFVFAQQVYAYGREGDTLVVIAADADPVLQAALRVAGSLGINRIVLTGRDDGDFHALAECVVRVPRVTHREIQELHLPMVNTFCTMLEQEFFS